MEGTNPIDTAATSRVGPYERLVYDINDSTNCVGCFDDGVYKHTCFYKTPRTFDQYGSFIVYDTYGPLEDGTGAGKGRSIQPSRPDVLRTTLENAGYLPDEQLPFRHLWVTLNGSHLADGQRLSDITNCCPTCQRYFKSTSQGPELCRFDPYYEPPKRKESQLINPLEELPFNHYEVKLAKRSVDCPKEPGYDESGRLDRWDEDWPYNPPKMPTHWKGWSSVFGSGFTPHMYKELFVAWMNKTAGFVLETMIRNNKIRKARAKRRRARDIKRKKAKSKATDVPDASQSSQGESEPDLSQEFHVPEVNDSQSDSQSQSQEPPTFKEPITQDEMSDDEPAPPTPIDFSVAIANSQQIPFSVDNSDNELQQTQEVETPGDEDSDPASPSQTLSQAGMALIELSTNAAKAQKKNRKRNPNKFASVDQENLHERAANALYLRGQPPAEPYPRTPLGPVRTPKDIRHRRNIQKLKWYHNHRAEVNQRKREAYIRRTQNTVTKRYSPRDFQGYDNSREEEPLHHVRCDCDKCNRKRCAKDKHEWIKWIDTTGEYGPEWDSKCKLCGIISK